MNDLVFNNKKYPLYVINPINNALMEAARTGDAYIMSQDLVANIVSVLGVINGGAGVKLLNPAGSGRRIIMERLIISNFGVSALAEVKVFKNANLDGTVGTVSTINTNFGSTKITVANNTYDTNLVSSPVSGGTLIERIGQIASVYTSILQSAIIIPPGNSIVISTESTVAVNLKFNVEIIYWEEDL